VEGNCVVVGDGVVVGTTVVDVVVVVVGRGVVLDVVARGVVVVVGGGVVVGATVVVVGRGVVLDVVARGVVVVVGGGVVVGATVVVVGRGVVLDEVARGVVVVVGGGVVDVVEVVGCGHSPSHMHWAEHPSPDTALPSSHSSKPNPGFIWLFVGQTGKITFDPSYRGFWNSSPTDCCTIIEGMFTSAPHEPGVICRSVSS
jgi:hypothetical protein